MKVRAEWRRLPVPPGWWTPPVWSWFYPSSECGCSLLFHPFFFLHNPGTRQGLINISLLPRSSWAVSGQSDGSVPGSWCSQPLSEASPGCLRGTEPAPVPFPARLHIPLQDFSFFSVHSSVSPAVCKDCRDPTVKLEGNARVGAWAQCLFLSAAQLAKTP